VDLGVPRRDARQLPGVLEDPRGVAGFVERVECLLEVTAPAVGLGDADQQAATFRGGIRSDFTQRGDELLGGAREVIRGQVKIADRFMLRRAIPGRMSCWSQIGGDRSLHFYEPS
jgi:hypothetical protein